MLSQPGPSRLKVTENKDVFIFWAISKGQFYARLLVVRVPILSTLPKNQAAILSVIVSLSRKLSNVPSMFLLTSQLTNSTPRRCKTHHRNRARFISQHPGHSLLLRETLKLMADGTIEFRHKAIRKNGKR